MIRNYSIYRKKQLLAKLLCLFHHLLAVFQLGVIAKRSADFISLCLLESISHTAADNQRVALLKKIRDNIQLIRNLCAAEDGNERTNRVLNGIAEELDFLLHQIANCAVAALFADIFGNDGNRSMCSVRGTECVAYIIIRKVGQLLRESLAGILRLGLLFASESGVLQENDIAVLHLLNCLCSSLAGYIVIRNELYFLSKLFGKSCRNRRKRLALVGAVLDLSEVRAQDHLCSLIDQLLNCRKRRDDTCIVRNLSLFQRNVEIASYQNSSVGCIEIIHSFFV